MKKVLVVFHAHLTERMVAEIREQVDGWIRDPDPSPEHLVAIIGDANVVVFDTESAEVEVHGPQA